MKVKELIIELLEFDQDMEVGVDIREIPYECSSSLMPQYDYTSYIELEIKEDRHENLFVAIW